MSADARVKRPEFLESLMSAAPRLEPEVEEAERSVKEARGAIPTPMLDVVLRSGRTRSFSYAFLSEVDYEPGDTVTLTYTNGKLVVIEGRNLSRARQQLRLHRADEVRECEQHEVAMDGEGISQIERITITEGDEQ